MLENIDQKSFEKLIELVITYKKLNPTENVYLNDKCIKRALDWYKNIQNHPELGLLGK